MPLNCQWLVELTNRVFALQFQKIVDTDAADADDDDEPDEEAVAKLEDDLIRGFQRVAENHLKIVKVSNVLYFFP